MTPEIPVILLGDTFRTTRDLHWMLESGESIRIPAGTRGELFPWDRPPYGKGCCAKLEGIPDRPGTKYYPMALTRPGVTRYPDYLELMSRKTERKVA